MTLTKAELIACLQDEIRILVHLCEKVQPPMLDCRPTPKQRSLLELLQYLTVMGPVLVSSIKAGKFLIDDWNTHETAAKAMDFDAVVVSLTSQSAFYAEAVGTITDEELREEIDWFATRMTRGRSLIASVLSGHAAYRMQVFLYLKSCGLEELNTMNLWAGVGALQ